MKQHLWKDKAICLGMDTDLFFDEYENNINEMSKKIDELCKQCPVRKCVLQMGFLEKSGAFGVEYT